jgi:L-arabinose isomerase
MITSTSEKANVAIMGCGHREYWPQFPGMREDLIKSTETFSNYIRKGEAELSECRFVDDIESAYRYGLELRAVGCELLFVYLPTYVASGRFMQGALAADCPIVLVGLQEDIDLSGGDLTLHELAASGSPCPMPEAYSAFVRCGRTPVGVLFGKLHGDAHIEKETAEWCRAANAYHAFKGSRFGYMGHTYEGMLDMNFDPTAITKTFGAHVLFVEMCELVSYIENCTEEDLQAKLDEVLSTFDLLSASSDPTTKDIDRSDINWAAKVAVGLDKLVTRHKLSGLAYYYMGENNSIYERAASNLMIGNSLMTTRGISMAGEADMKTCLAMYITSALGCGGSFAEFVEVDFRNDVMIVGHDGPHDIRISDKKPTIRGLSLMHGKKGYGVSVEFSIKNGPITMVGIGSDEHGKFHLIVAEGESQEGWVPPIGNTLTRGYFGPNVSNFLEDWCRALPCHHVSLSIGHNGDMVEKFGKLMSLETIRVR